MGDTISKCTGEERESYIRAQEEARARELLSHPHLVAIPEHHRARPQRCPPPIDRPTDALLSLRMDRNNRPPTLPSQPLTNARGDFVRPELVDEAYNVSVAAAIQKSMQEGKARAEREAMKQKQQQQADSASPKSDVSASIHATTESSASSHLSLFAGSSIQGLGAAGDLGSNAYSWQKLQAIPYPTSSGNPTGPSVTATRHASPSISSAAPYTSTLSHAAQPMLTPMDLSMDGSSASHPPLYAPSFPASIAKLSPLLQEAERTRKQVEKKKKKEVKQKQKQQQQQQQAAAAMEERQTAMTAKAKEEGMADKHNDEEKESTNQQSAPVSSFSFSYEPQQ